ncbi:hypothetical protein A2U01_0081132, partial [Trifolium medium]|nr:hypothetical protein [Trifolium medium]
TEPVFLASSLGEIKRKKASKNLKVRRCSERKRQEKLKNRNFIASATESDRKLQETGNSWLERKKATSAMLARWHGRWASKP